MGVTINEAILALNANAVIACERAGFNSATVKMIEDALGTIEGALKEQEPVKPKYEDYFGHRFAVCENCGNYIMRYEKYCPGCGRKVDWGD